jgi:hypothetical protein
MDSSRGVETQTVVVLGSKPEAQFPEIEAPVVLAANGAVELALEYRRRYGSRTVGLVPGVELLKHPHIQESFKKGAPDEIIVFGDGGVDIVAFIRETLKLADAQITVYTIRERHQFMKHVLGWRVLLVMYERIRVRGLHHFVTKVIPDILFHGDMDWLSHSTGLDAIMYAMKRFPRAEYIIAAGIGLQGGAHFNKVGEFMQKTAIADRGTMKHWPPFLRKNVVTTDDNLSEIGNIPKWDSKLFSP